MTDSQVVVWMIANDFSVQEIAFVFKILGVLFGFFLGMVIRFFFPRIRIVRIVEKKEVIVPRDRAVLANPCSFRGVEVVKTYRPAEKTRVRV